MCKHELAGLDSIDLKLVLISAGSANFALDDQKRNGKKFAGEEKYLATHPKSPLMLEKRPRFCNGYHLTSPGAPGMKLTGTTTLPRKLLLLPVPLFRSFCTLISKSPGIDGSTMRNSNCATFTAHFQALDLFAANEYDHDAANTTLKSQTKLLQSTDFNIASIS
jgi:hypothetical protein